MSDILVTSDSSTEPVKRKFLPWNTHCCGGLAIHGTSTCSSDIDEMRTRVCYCNPPPDQNFVLSYNLASKVYEQGLHICDKDVGNAWSMFAAKFCSQTQTAVYDPIQGPAAKKSFHSIVKKARVLLSMKGESSHLTPYETLMKKIINDMDILIREKTEVQHQKQIIEAERKNYLSTFSRTMDVSSHSIHTNDSNDSEEHIGMKRLPSVSSSTNSSSMILTNSSTSNVHESLSSSSSMMMSKKVKMSSQSINLSELSSPRKYHDVSVTSSNGGSGGGNSPHIQSLHTEDKSRSRKDSASNTSSSIKELELRERQLVLEENKLKFERDRWEADIRYREEVVKTQASQIEAQNKLILSLLEKINSPLERD